MFVLFAVENFKKYLLTCPSKHYLGIDCPGCGLQRSILDLFEGHFAESFAIYPATVPMLLTFAFTALHLVFDFKHGATVIKWSYITVAAIVVIFYVYKILTHKLV